MWVSGLWIFRDTSEKLLPLLAVWVCGSLILERHLVMVVEFVKWKENCNMGEQYVDVIDIGENH